MSIKQAGRLAFAALAFVFFFTPVALRAVGVRARPFENRQLQPAPRLGDGWSVFAETARFFVDRMPLREQAVHANTWLSLRVFDTTPRYGQNASGASDQALPFVGAPGGGAETRVGGQSRSKSAAAPPPTADQVLVGRDGWMYLSDVFARACMPLMPFAKALTAWTHMMHIIRASGRNVVLVVPADKSVIYPEHVPPDAPNVKCSLGGERQLWSVIDSARSAGVIGLRTALLAERHTTRDLLFFRQDSHWDTVGAVTLPESVVPALDPTIHVQTSEVVFSGPSKHTGDLTNLLGAPQTDTAPGLYIRRRPGAPVIRGSSVFVLDSYGDVALPLLSPYFAHLQTVGWYTDPVPKIVQDIAAAHTVVLETVDRDFDYKATPEAFGGPKFLGMLSAALSDTPVP